MYISNIESSMVRNVYKTIQLELQIGRNAENAKLASMQKLQLQIRIGPLERTARPLYHSIEWERQLTASYRNAIED